MDTFNGQIIKGYELQERIGSGGFGAVYKAYQSTVGREVAVKIILPGFANHPDFIRRFENEAQLVARLEHLHIVPLYDYWRDPDGAYLVMRWLRGGSLRDALQHGPYQVEITLRVLDQIGSALAAAHASGIIHRDVKPGNILLDEDGNAYLADFGIAKDLNLQSATTEVDAIIGSPDYLSPEQARSEPVTPQTDVYSLGVVLYEMLTGKYPFPGLSTVERMYKHLNEPLPLIASFGPPLRDGINDVIQKATDKNPARRYSDALALAEAFRQAAALEVSSTSASILELFTQREHEILAFIIEGRSNKEIAEKLYVTVATVKWYITQIYRKLGVRSRIQAIVRARELDLITPHPSATDTSSAAGATLLPTDQFRPVNPYKGLHAFQAADERDFFGRETLVEKLIKRLGESGDGSRFLAVIGPSGSGKSSLVKAGLIPALWRGELTGSEKWFVVEMLPGARPLDELEVALTRLAAHQPGNFREHLERDHFGLLRSAALILPDDGSELVLVIDQFEEVFTLVEDEAARVHFLHLLHTAVTETRSRVHVIVTLRADFYDRPLQYPEFGELVRTRMETILPLSAKGLERAIAAPAEAAGVRFEEGLVASIVAEMNYQTGALPLLQYALTELFEQRERRMLTHAAYQQLGGAVGALAKRAEQLYGELSPEGQETTRQMFMRLVTLGEGVEDTRRRVPRSELLAVSPNTDLVDDIIDTFTEYRLFSLDHDPSTRTPMVEVAHEAILREWERLRGWLNANREDIRLQRQLAAQAAEWNGAGHESSFLLRGTRLDAFQKWAAESSLALTQVERDFLNSSATEQERQVAVEGVREANEVRLERRSQTFLRGLVAVLLLATVGAFILTGLAANQSQRAQAQSRIAQSRELVRYAVDQLITDGELSTLLALQAVNLTRDADGTVLPEAEAMLHQAVGALHTPLRFTDVAGTVGYFAGLSPDGTRLAYALKNGDVFGAAGVTAIADPQSRQLLYQLPGDVWALYISAQNRIIIGARVDDTMQLQVWDIASSDHPTLLSRVAEPFELWHSEDGTFVIQADVITVSPDLHYLLAIMAADGRVRIWDLTSGKEIVTPATRKLPDGNGQPTFSPDGTRLGRVNPDGKLSILDTNTWEETVHFSLANATISGDNEFRFSEDGQRIAAINKDNTVTVWDTATGAALYTFYPPTAPAQVAVNVDGTRVAVANSSGQVTIWNVTTLQEELAFGTSDKLDGLMLSSDGTRLATLHESGQLQLWDLVPGREALTLVNHDSDEDLAAVGLAYSPDGQRLLATGTSTTPNVWDVRTGQKLLTLAGHTGRVRAADWSADGRLLATGGEDDSVIVWDATTGAVRFTLTGYTDTVFAVAFSPDSRYLAASSFDGSLRVWDVNTGEFVFTITHAGVKQSRGLAWSPDGLHIANITIGIDPQQGDHLYILNALTGAIEHDTTVESNETVQQLMYSPDGSRIASAATGLQEYRIYDAHSGQKLLTLPGHGVLASAIAFSPDGSLIATGGYDNLAQLWNANTGKELLKLFTPSGDTYRLAFSPDGTHLALQGEDSTTRIYVVHLDDLMALAKSRLTRTFTPQECQQYLHTDVCPAG
ncbi:MAG: protein kinase [Chloroflexota bacterium]